MRIVILGNCLSWAAILCLFVTLLLCARRVLAADVTLSSSIDGVQAASKPPGSAFPVWINISWVTDLAAYDLKVTYDPAVIQIMTPLPGSVSGTLWVTPGLIDSAVMPLETAVFFPPESQGTARIWGKTPRVPVSRSVSGSGYLCEVH